MLVTLTWRSLQKGRYQSFLQIFTLSAVVAFLGGILLLAFSAGERWSAEVQSTGANIRLLPRSQNLALDVDKAAAPPSQASLDISELKNIGDVFWKNNIVGFSPWLKSDFALENGATLPVYGLWRNREFPLHDDPFSRSGWETLRLNWVLEGQWPKENEPAPTEMALGKGLMEKLKRSIGDSVTLKSSQGVTRAIKIVGSLKTSDDTHMNSAFVDLESLQNLLGHKGQASGVQVAAITLPEDTLSQRARTDADSLSSLEHDRWYCSPYVSTIAAQLEEAMPHISARPVWGVAEAQSAFVNRVQSLVWVVTGASLIVAALAIESLQFALLRARFKEFALIVALGGTVESVHRQLQLEMAAKSLVGGVVGAFLAVPLGHYLSHSVFQQDIVLVPLIFPLLILGALFVGAWALHRPLHSVKSLQPHTLLQGGAA